MLTNRRCATLFLVLLAGFLVACPAPPAEPSPSQSATTPTASPVPNTLVPTPPPEPTEEGPLSGLIAEIPEVYVPEAGYRRLSGSLEDVQDLLCLDHFGAAQASITAGLHRPTSIFCYAGHTDVDGDRGYLMGDSHEQPGVGAKGERFYSETLGPSLDEAITWARLHISGTGHLSLYREL